MTRVRKKNAESRHTAEPGGAAPKRTRPGTAPLGNAGSDAARAGRCWARAGPGSGRCWGGCRPGWGPEPGPGLGLGSGRCWARAGPCRSPAAAAGPGPAPWLPRLSRALVPWAAAGHCPPRVWFAARSLPEPGKWAQPNLPRGRSPFRVSHICYQSPVAPQIPSLPSRCFSHLTRINLIPLPLPHLKGTSSLLGVSVQLDASCLS